MKRIKIKQQGYFKLVLASLLIGLLSSILTLLLKHVTEYLENSIFKTVLRFNSLLFILLPTIGLTIIYFLRKYLFKNQKNKGISEIYNSLDNRKNNLPLYKIPSHFVNGFLTVIFGGSTGIEVSSVVASAAIGNAGYENQFSAKIYKQELICAGVTAGVAMLFCSPLAGIFFAIEVIARKRNKTLLLSCGLAALVSWSLIYIFKEPTLLPYSIIKWNYYAIPFFVILSLLGSLLSVYFTLLVIRIKKFFNGINVNFLRVNLGALLVGIIILFFPVLYGDSYHGLKEVLNQNLNNHTVSVFLLLGVLLLKPIAAALTLGAGGDGGVFAPSIVAGAFLGLLLATFLNSNFNMHLIPLNFALVGAAATLSASLYAPFTSVILVCALVPNGTLLFLPTLMSCILAQMISKKIVPYNVYTYESYIMSKT